MLLPIRKKIIKLKKNFSQMETKLFSTSVNSPLLQKLKTYLAVTAVMMPKIQMLSFLILLFALVSTLKMTLMLVTLLVSKS